MKLSKNEVNLYLKVYNHLLLFVNKEKKVVKSIKTLNNFDESDFEHKYKIRNTLYKNPSLFDKFLDENPYNFLLHELNIIREFKKYRIEDKFVIMRHLKNYSVFMDSNDENGKLYGVVGLKSSIEEITNGQTPFLAEAVLLPFQGKIVFDGFLHGFNIYFGRSISNDWREMYNQAKAKYGIITSLPFLEKEKTLDDEELLKYYLKSMNNLNIYSEEIHELMNKSHKLNVLFHHEFSKLHAKIASKDLRKAGVQQGYFAMLRDLVIAGNETKEGLEKTIKHILPKEKRELMYVFQIKKK